MGNIVRNTSIAFLMFYQINIFSEVYTTGSAVDNSGNIIVIGYCIGNVNIGGDQFNLTFSSTFVLKLDPVGNKIWINFINSNRSINTKAIATDIFGNIYLTGGFSGTANFGSTSLTAQYTDAFILKYDQSGNTIWVKHGITTSPIISASGNDIFISENSFIYVCGIGQPISFDGLSTSGRGFTVVLNTAGQSLLLFNSFSTAYQITLDMSENILISGGELGPPGQVYWNMFGKFNALGNLIWQKSGAAPTTTMNRFFLSVDSQNYIYSALQYGTETYFSKYDSAGNTILSLPYYSKFGITDLKNQNDNQLLISGSYLPNAQFGDSVLISNGAKDAYVAKIDTAFNPLWIKHGGGSYNDEVVSISNLQDGSIISCGNFSGTINFDTLQISGGTGIDNRWAAVTKVDNDGNLIWFKKIAEDFVEPSTTNWFPLEVGNKWQFFTSEGYFNPHGTMLTIENISVTDAVTINDKKFYTINKLVYLTSAKVRFDMDLQKIIVYLNGQEHTYMDFNLPDGATFQQIQQNGTFYPLTVDTKIIQVLDSTISVKGFYAHSSYENGWYMFAPNIGFVFQDEHTLNPTYPYRGPEIDMELLEYLIYDSLETRHKKHNYIPDIQFEPIVYLPDTAILKQEFIIDHQYSMLNTTIISGVTYIKNAYFESLYFNGIDSIIQPIKPIAPLDQKLFSLNYQFDTTMYNQGYNLYYRIAAVDKGIIADTFYSPQSGYYKLYWRDSTTSVTQISPEVFDYCLSQNYPNPFNPNTKISFSIPEREFVSLKVFDILGSEIATLVNEELNAGRYEVDFDGRSLSSGIYIYQIRSGNFINIKKMLLIK